MALHGQARSLGATFASLPLIDARIDQLTTGYGPLSGRPVTRGSGVEFIYGDSGGLLNGNPFLRMSEALSPQMAYGLEVEGAALRNEALLLMRFENQTVTSNGKTAARRSLWVGKTRVGGLYVALQGSSRQVVLDAARTIGRSK
jgi:hypothetical protein